MMNPELTQDRLGWLTNEPQTSGRRQRLTVGTKSRVEDDELRVSDSSDTLYFVGCAPYFDVQFGHLGVDGSGVARATVRALNAVGIEPQVLADERCCGHDLLWEGDVEGFRQLAELNAMLVQQSGAKQIVTACPECARTLKVDYASHGICLDVDVLHLTQLLVGSAWPAFQDATRNTQHASCVTYQDPCRLGRHLGVYDAPRQLIQELGLELIEMPRHKENALCCGTNGWTHCGAANKEIQVDRLSEARATNADVLVTACLKCQIHFRCAMQDRQFSRDMAIEIKDLAVLVAEALR
jgi:Fe-S oxidoreductase